MSKEECNAEVKQTDEMLELVVECPPAEEVQTDEQR